MVANIDANTLQTSVPKTALDDARNRLSNNLLGGRKDADLKNNWFRRETTIVQIPQSLLQTQTNAENNNNKSIQGPSQSRRQINAKTMLENNCKNNEIMRPIWNPKGSLNCKFNKTWRTHSRLVWPLPSTCLYNCHSRKWVRRYIRKAATSLRVQQGWEWGWAAPWGKPLLEKVSSPARQYLDHLGARKSPGGMRLTHDGMRQANSKKLTKNT